MKQVAITWFNEKKADSRRGRDLTRLIRARFPLPRKERDVFQGLWDIEDEVAKRLAPLCTRLARNLPENEVTAALDAVADTLEEADLSDQELLSFDLDPSELYGEIRRAHPLATKRAGLNSRATELYYATLERACIVLVHLTKELPEFSATTAVESLRRLTSISAKLDAILELIRVDTALKGIDQDDQFRREYLAYLASALDRLDLLGLTMRHRPRLMLSMAYLSLSVTEIDNPARKLGTQRDRTSSFNEWFAKDSANRTSGTMRVETALSTSTRTLIRGDAGSGKTTLLDWLAVTAAQAGFTGKLKKWNGYTPFPIRLRSYAGAALPAPEQFLEHSAAVLVPHVPNGWVRRCLLSGKALVLVDGVDEVPPSKRRHVRSWLNELTILFPDVKIIVTSRPAAADRQWLIEESFSSVSLDQMSSSDIKMFLRRWHQAATQARSLPCDPSELPVAEQRLVSQLNSRPHLRTLATNPLLCAMLCALNLERTSELPHNRMDLYRNALDMLLHLRDTERGIHNPLDASEKTALLRDLSWRLTTSNRAEVTTERMLEYVTIKLPAMPNVHLSASEVTEHLLARSGIVREPVPGRVDFVHRTFQEYLAAEEATEDSQIPTLAANAHLDSWWETIVMACGHSKRPQLRELLTDVLDRADAEPKHARHLRLLAAACLETITEIDPELLARIEKSIKNNLVPPRGMRETLSLATIGHRVLQYLPEDLDELSEARAAATVRSAWLTGNPEVLGRLARYARDSRSSVQREIATAWEYFDPARYANEVLADSPLDNGWITVYSMRLLPHVNALRNLKNLSIGTRGDDEEQDLSAIHGLPRLTTLAMRLQGDIDISPLAEHDGLKSVRLYWGQRYRKLNSLARLMNLERLTLFLKIDTHWPNLRFVKNFTQVSTVTLDRLERITDFSPLAQLSHTTDLTLYDGKLPNGFTAFTPSPSISSLQLSNFEELTLDAIEVAMPNIKSLSMMDNAICDLSPLRHCLNLSELRLENSETPMDLSPLADLSLNLELHGPAASWIDMDRLGTGVKVKQNPL